MVPKIAVLALFVSGVSLAACSSSSSGTGGGGTHPDGGTASDSGSGATTDAMSDAAANGDVYVAEVINGCTGGKYMDMSTGSDSNRMIMMTQANMFDMPCMTIAAGQGAMFMWDFTQYAISPGVAPSHSGDPTGTMPNPIQMHATGMSYTVQFPTAGFYPFYVPGHDTSGLLGVIQVK